MINIGSLSFWLIFKYQLAKNRQISQTFFEVWLNFSNVIQQTLKLKIKATFCGFITW